MIRFACLALLLLIRPLCALPRSGGPVVINEFCYDDTGVDDREFVELYNRSSTAVDLGGWVLTSEDPLGRNPSYTIPANTKLAAGGWFVLGSARVPRVNLVVGTTNLWENNQESLTLRDTKGRIVDTVVFESWRGVWNRALVEGEGVWSDFTSVDGIETSWSRVRDGQDTGNNRDFRLVAASPGTSNRLAFGGYIDNFNARPVGAQVFDFGGSFARPHVIDPRRQSILNPSKLVASPDGGNASVFWDPRGGGNHCMLLRDGAVDVVVEAWVYFAAQPLGAGEREAWSLGVQGTSGTFYRFPNLSGKDPGFVANGNTGIALSYERTSSGGVLYLMDHNDGGWGRGARSRPRLLGKVAIQPGRNDGWQRLRLEVRGALVEARFGGTWGCSSDGILLTGKAAAPALGGVWVAYREQLQSLARARPFTCDRLEIRAPIGGAFHSGTAKATTRGLPRLEAPVAPLLGRRDFALEARGLVPSSVSVLAFGSMRLSPPIDLGRLGGQRGSFVQVRGDVLQTVTSRADGTLRLVFALPCLPSLVGASLHWQLFDVDPALRVKLPLGNSDLLTTTFGR